MTRSAFFFLAALSALLFISCGQQDNGQMHSNSYEVSQFDQNGFNQQEPVSQEMNHQVQSVSSRAKTIRVTDRNTGIDMWSIDLPSGWTWNHTLDYSKSPQFPGVDWRANHQSGAVMQNIRSDVYQFSNDQQMVQMMRAGKMIIRPVQNANSVNQNQVAQMMGNNGYQLKGQPTSEPSHVSRIMNSARQMGLNNVQMTCLTANWVNSNGQEARTLLYHGILNNGNMQSWFYETVIIEGKGKQFGKVVSQIEKAIKNIDHNPQWASHYRSVLNQMAQQNRQAQQQSFQAHQQRMRNNQRSFEATQQAYRDANDAVSSSINSSYQTRSQSQDAGHNAFIDNIRDEQNVYDPNSGNSYKVESGYNNYYFNNNDEYIGTNDNNWDPNVGYDTDYWSEGQPY